MVFQISNKTSHIPFTPDCDTFPATEFRQMQDGKASQSQSHSLSVDQLPKTLTTASAKGRDHTRTLAHVKTVLRIKTLTLALGSISWGFTSPHEPVQAGLASEDCRFAGVKIWDVL